MLTLELFTGDSLVRLAYDNETQASFTNQSTEETICPVVDAVTGLSTQLQGLLTSLSLIALGGTATSAQTAAVQKLLGKSRSLDQNTQNPFERRRSICEKEI